MAIPSRTPRRPRRTSSGFVQKRLVQEVGRHEVLIACGLCDCGSLPGPVELHALGGTGVEPRRNVDFCVLTGCGLERGGKRARVYACRSCGTWILVKVGVICNIKRESSRTLPYIGARAARRGAQRPAAVTTRSQIVMQPVVCEDLTSEGKSQRALVLTISVRA